MSALCQKQTYLLVLCSPNFAGAKSNSGRRNGRAREFASWSKSRRFRLIYLNERVARPLFVFAERDESSLRAIYGCLRVH
jgi:hypothetical protein